MFNFLQSIFAKIATAITAVLASVGLISSPALPTDNASVSTTAEVAVAEEVIAKPAAKPTSDPVAEELRRLRQELAVLKNDKEQSVPAQSANSKPSSTSQNFANLSGEMPLSGSDILKKVGPATVFILTDVGCGTGFIIDKTGLTLTNAHVVKDKRNFQISFANGIKTNAELVGIDGTKDIALIKVSGSNLPFLELGSSNPYIVSAGDNIFAVGYPGIANLATCDKGQELTIVKGIINARRIVDAVEYFQIDALIQHGNSGGPLVNEYGQVVGINTSGFTSGGFSTGVNFALTIDLAKDLLPKLKQGLVIPAFGSDVEIPKNVKLRADNLLDLDCAVFLGGELAQYVNVCKLYRQYPTQYNWLVVDQ